MYVPLLCNRLFNCIFIFSDTSHKECNARITNFEHIEVEADERSTYAFEDEQEEETVNIQCTPDIYTEPVEPGLDPIEIVQCETNETNPNM